MMGKTITADSWTIICVLTHSCKVDYTEQLVESVTSLRDAIVSCSVSEREDFIHAEEDTFFPVHGKTKDIFVRDFYELFCDHFRYEIMPSKKVPGVIIGGPPLVGKVRCACN